MKKSLGSKLKNTALCIGAVSLGLLNSGCEDLFNLTSGQEAQVAHFARTALRNAPRGKINNFYTEHNAYSGNEKGMIIHTSFDVENSVGRPHEIGAYFYWDSGSKLLDRDGLYKTGDGQVAVGEANLIPPYISTNFDTKLFIPYNQFHLGSGQHNLKFNLILWDKTEGQIKIDETNYQGISLNNN